jgi:hypothetical protein
MVALVFTIQVNLRTSDFTEYDGMQRRFLSKNLGSFKTACQRGQDLV